MFWSLAIVAMRQQHYKTILDIPLSLARADELINYYLSTISEVTELSLPKNKGVGVSLRIAQLESEHGKL